ncbi:MAG: hypothetical protein D6766_02310 [Verrucomicrobia bacterium]|nr:MAG: hypothetical protein D6766_02310 [Verrucomicrobiota bacterium]
MRPAGRQPNRRHRPGRWTLVLLLGMLLGSCSPERKQAWLEFFFDGVPDPNAPAPTQARPGARVTPAQQALSNALSQAAQRRARGSVHPPFAERQCQKCHQSRFSQNLKLPREELCFSCHATFMGDRPWQHSPALAGACLMCHHPHRTERPHLLLVEGAPLCLQCHEVRDLSRIPPHADPLKRTCYKCHDPHGGDHPYFLRPEAPPSGAEPPAEETAPETPENAAPDTQG